jgi:hypothetical protein
MNAMQHAGPLDVFKARSNKAFAILLWTLAVLGLIVTVVQTGVGGLRFAAPLVLMAFVGWALFWRPAVVVSDVGVELVNPVRRIGVPWEALAFVDTKYALTLGTGARRYSAWAAPAPGVWGARNARPEHVSGLPETSYGPAQSIRPGDLRNTVSGQAALIVRQRWADRVQRGAIEGGQTAETPVLRSTAWGVVVTTAALAAASVVTLIA